MSRIRLTGLSLALVLSATCVVGCGGDRVLPEAKTAVDVVERDILEHAQSSPPTKDPSGQYGKNSAGESVAETGVSSDYAP